MDQGTKTGDGVAQPTGSGRTWLLIGVLFALAWGLFLKFFGPAGPVPAPTVPDLEGTGLAVPADYDWTPRDPEGRPVPFARFRGKTVLLNVWATWCGPCVEELPTIAALARSPSLGDVAFVCVSVDDDPSAVRLFLEGKSWPMTFLNARADELPAVFRAEGGALPATYLIAPDGRVAATTVGSADWSDPSVVDFLERLSRPRAPTATEAR